MVLSITTNHGVHTGDLVGFGLCYGAVLLGTAALRPWRGGPPRPPGPATSAPRRLDAPPTSGRTPTPAPAGPWRAGHGDRADAADRTMRTPSSARLADARRPADPGATADGRA